MRVERVDRRPPRRSGENAFSCTTSGHAGKYGSRPFARTRSPTRDERRRVALRGRRRSRGRSTPGESPSRDGRARRGSARSRGSASGRAGRAPCAPPRGPRRRRARPRPCSRGCSTASRRRRRGEVRQRALEALDAAPRSRSAISIPAGLRSQTPISQTASNPSAAIASHSLAGHVGETDLAPSGAQLASQTHVLIS